MKDCDPNNPNQEWIFNPEQKKSNDPEPVIKNDKREFKRRFK